MNFTPSTRRMYVYRLTQVRAGASGKAYVAERLQALYEDVVAYGMMAGRLKTRAAIEYCKNEETAIRADIEMLRKLHKLEA